MRVFHAFFTLPAAWFHRVTHPDKHRDEIFNILRH
jgi:hypothetical protein